MSEIEYRFTIRPLVEDEGDGYLIEFPDLPGCMSDGETIEEAIANGEDAKRCWIAAMKDAGRPIPPPSVEPAEGYSGKWQLRAPKSLHRRHLLSAPSAKASVSTPSRSRCWRKGSASARRMATDQAGHYRLNDEQRARVRNCLAKVQISLPRGCSERFVSDIEASIDHFRSAPREDRFREASDALRALWKRCHLDKPPVQVLREELRELPERAIEYMGRRARTVISQLFPGATIDEDVFDLPDRLAARLLAWAAAADDQKFVEALRVLSFEGAHPVPGRSRGGGKRSHARFEPVIMGEARGAGARDHTGGRPTEDARHKLVMDLAWAWQTATDQAPEAGRSDSTGFGDLVHSIFQWLDVSVDTSEAATYALRRYWGAKKRAAAFVIPLVCTECRWVRPGANRDEPFCDKLGLACVTAREAEQKCGPEGLLFEQAM